MDAKDHPGISVLSDQKRFMVPIYQRQYSWSNKHWMAFWEDVVAKAEETLDGKPKFKHYMGCQSACKFDPVSASNFDPFERRGLAVALVSPELAGIAETRRARVA